MFLSRLITASEAPLFPLESFDSEATRDAQEAESLESEDGYVKLPLSKGPARLRREKAGEEKRASDSDKEEDIRDRLARLEREAYEKGFEQGQKDGLALEQRQMEEKGKQLEALFNALNQLKEQIYAEAEGEVLKVGLAVARKIVRNEVKTENRIIEETIRAALKFVVDKSHIRIRISPDDMEEVRAALPSLAAMTKAGRFQIVEDTAIGRGGCILDTGFGRINATIEDQLGMLEKEIERAFESSRGVSR
jgi:flagellar biosynthesis/type III secretory pathway protein FliH